jgi:hypothetical protein
VICGTRDEGQVELTPLRVLSRAFRAFSASAAIGAETVQVDASLIDCLLHPADKVLCVSNDLASVALKGAVLP